MTDGWVRPRRRGPSPWRLTAPVPPPKQPGGGTGTRFARGSFGRRRRWIRFAEAHAGPVASTPTSATQIPVVREGGLRVVVAANSFALPSSKARRRGPVHLHRTPLSFPSPNL